MLKGSDPDSSNVFGYKTLVKIPVPYLYDSECTIEGCESIKIYMDPDTGTTLYFEESRS